MSNEKNIQKAYLCCKKEKKEQYKKIIRSQYRNIILFSDLMCDCDFVIVAGELDRNMTDELERAKELNKSVDFLEKHLEHSPEREKEHGYAPRNHSLEYEL